MRRNGLEMPSEEILLTEINIAKDDFSNDVGGFPGYAYGTTTAGTERYQIPSQLMRLDRIEYSDKMLDRIYTDALEKFTVPTSGSITWTITNETGVTATGIVADTNILTFTSGDATPSISSYYFFKTAGTTPITNFDDPPSSGAKLITIFINSSISIVHDATKINLSGNINASFIAGDMLQFAYNGTAWYETSRILG